jgi:CheY-like chemotaxis protein
MRDSERRRPVVLVVDDNTDIVEAYCEILRRGGLDTVATSRGLEALDLAVRTRPDVVLIDLWMPGMDGFEVARALKTDPRTSATPIVAFTSLGYTERKAEEAGCDALVRKGVEPEQLLEILRRFAPAAGTTESERVEER